MPARPARPLVVTRSAMITLRTLGECIVEVDGEPLGPDADAAFAALVLLAAERGRQLSRRHVAELFWPGVAESRARHSLRQLLYRLRAYDIELDAGREHIRLAPELITPTFAADPTLERLREARAAGTLVIGPCLPGYAPAFSPAFTEWLDNHRSVVEAMVRRALLQEAHEHQLRGEWREADLLARECLRLDPLNEDATLRRAECIAMLGGKAEALAILDRYNAEMGERGAGVVLPTAVLRRRISEQLPSRRYAIPSDRCFVGREGVMSVLTVALLRAKNREGSSTLLWGAPGIGKTRIAQELTSVAVVQGLRVVRVQCEESDIRQPMSAWVDAVPQLLRVPGALGVSPDAMPFLKRLTEFDPTLREPSPEAREPQYLAGRIRQAIVDLVDAIAGEAPLFLLFEDVHWMDGASWAALRMLLEWNASKAVMILMTARRPHATPTPPQREVPRLELHEVGALDARAASLLVHAIAADFGGPLPEGTEAWCLGVGEGNPLFLRELVVDCLVEGQPRAVPPSVQTLLDARIARLRPRARQVLQASAILGEHATIDRLDSVLGMPTYDLVGALDELSEAGLIASGGGVVRPRHELVATRIAAATSDGSRRLLHRRSALALESDVAQGATLETMWACAEHWKSTGNITRALVLALASANRHIELGLPDEAIAVCDGAEALCSNQSERFDVLRLRARALASASRLLQAVAVLGELTSAEKGTVPHAVWATDILSSIDAEVRATGPALASAELAAGLAGDAHLDFPIRLRAAKLSLVIATNTSSEPIAKRVWASVAQIADTGGPVRVDGLLVSIIYHLTFGDLAQGCDATEELARHVRMESHTYASIPILINLTDAHRICGKLSAAAEFAAQAFALSVRFSVAHFAFRAAHDGFELAEELGNQDAARNWFYELTQCATMLNDSESTIEFMQLSARFHLLNGDPIGAFAIADAARGEWQRRGSSSKTRQRSILTTLVECQLTATEGRIQADLLDSLLELQVTMADTSMSDRSIRVLYRALARNERCEEAERLLSSYAERRGGLATKLVEMLRSERALETLRNSLKES